MNRRKLIALAGGAVIGWPLATHARLPSSPRRVAVLTGPSPDDPLAISQVAALQNALETMGLSNGRDIDLIVRGGAANPRQVGATAKDLVALEPDVIVAASTPGVAALLRETATIAIVFVNVADPQGSGFVRSIDRPGGSVTGFTNFEISMAGKWVQMIKEMVPNTQRALAVYDPGTRPSMEYLEVAKVAASSAQLELQALAVQRPSDLNHAISDFGSKPYGALVVLPDVVTVANRRLIIDLAHEHQLPAVYGFGFFATEGGLIAYGPKSEDLFRRAADYVARILKGENPAELPVQAPTKFELIVNQRTAAALGITIPHSILLLADRVIE